MSPHYQNTTIPVLYTFRRCPYAMRARMAIHYSRVEVEQREILLRDKPPQMLACSAKGTVPVLQLPDGRVIDESLDIMHWVLKINDPEHWLSPSSDQEQLTWQLIRENDQVFKQHLDHYKYADRHPEHPQEYYRQQGEVFLNRLNSLLEQQRYLTGNSQALADSAIAPFIRQFAHVDKAWFSASGYDHLRQWLESILTSPLFTEIMIKQPVWDYPK